MVIIAVSIHQLEQTQHGSLITSHMKEKLAQQKRENSKHMTQVGMGVGRQCIQKYRQDDDRTIMRNDDRTAG